MYVPYQGVEGTSIYWLLFFFFQAEDGIRDYKVTGVQTCALPICYEFTSQIYFDDALTDQIHALAPYSPTGRGRIRNQEDRIFHDGGKELMLPLTPQSPGYAGTFDIGLLLT